LFTKTLSQIFTKEALLEAYRQINKASSGIDNISFIEFEKDLNENITNLHHKILTATYAPEPIKHIEIDKPNSDEKRLISISAIKDKIVQRVLYESLNPYFDDKFSDKSYAYRADKSVIKALNRVTDFLNKKYLIALKSDIDNFFDTLSHDILITTLQQHISDNQITKLIALFLKTGGFMQFDYSSHLLGVHQGDILSPLLSNIYLDKMDKYLESKEIAFVRYADDFVLLFRKKEDAENELNNLKEFLSKINLKLENKKTYIAHISDGFSFLGVEFIGRNRLVQNERFQKLISNIHKLNKTNSNFNEFIKSFNSYLYIIKNHYLKIISKNSTQYMLLQEAIIDSIAQKIYFLKKDGTKISKKELKEQIKEIRFDIIFELSQINSASKLAIAKGYEKYLSTKTYKDTDAKIAKKRDKYSKKFALQSTIHILTPGLFVGISKNKITIKEYGKVKKSYPLDRVKRLIIESQAVTLSSKLIKVCATNNITIDFIDKKYTPYASLVTFNASTTQIVSKQAKILNTPMQLKLAKTFIKGKIKNQLNYLKYLNKYHKTLDTKIESIEANSKKIKQSSSIEQLMGIEGSSSATYWSAISLILDVPFEARVTKGAKDLVNSSLNYAYAILYGKVQSALTQAGLSLQISFLHALNGNKPTLSFDLIEEFRTFIVDRVIFAMLNKNEPIKLNKDGLLTKKSRQLIAKNIYEKLGSYTMWKKESRKVENIIQTQAYNLAKVVNEEEKTYKPFIGKY